MSQFVLTFTYLSSWLILPPLAFHILLHATVSAMDYTPNVVSKRCFFFIFKHSWAPKRSYKISHGGPWKSWIFFQWKSGNPAYNLYCVGGDVKHQNPIQSVGPCRGIDPLNAIMFLNDCRLLSLFVMISLHKQALSLINQIQTTLHRAPVTLYLLL